MCRPVLRDEIRLQLLCDLQLDLSVRTDGASLTFHRRLNLRVRLMSPAEKCLTNISVEQNTVYKVFQLLWCKHSSHD